MPCCIREGLYNSVHHVKHIGIPILSMGAYTCLLVLHV